MYCLVSLCMILSRCLQKGIIYCMVVVVLLSTGITLGIRQCTIVARGVHQVSMANMLLLMKYLQQARLNVPSKK